MTEDQIRADEQERPVFEAWVSSPPFEYSAERFGKSSAWPGNYRDIAVDLAWHSWLASARSRRMLLKQAKDALELDAYGARPVPEVLAALRSLNAALGQG